MNNELIHIPRGPFGDEWDAWEIPVPPEGAFDCVEIATLLGDDTIIGRFERSSELGRFTLVNYGSRAAMPPRRAHLLNDSGAHLHHKDLETRARPRLGPGDHLVSRGGTLHREGRQC